MFKRNNFIKIISLALGLVLCINLMTAQAALPTTEETNSPYATVGSGHDSGRWPNDMHTLTYNEEFLGDAKFPSAWLLQTTSSIPVGIVDGGFDADHEDLLGSYMGGYDCTGDGQGINFDTTGHGTKVAGIVGAVGNNGKGVSGVCWASHLKNLRIRGTTGLQPYEAMAIAINYAQSIGIKILNISYEISDWTTDLVLAINNYDGLIICSAGNAGVNNDTTMHYPSNYAADNIIAVGALNSDCTGMLDASNYGATTVDVFAPGENIRTTADNNMYVTSSGTSFAAPFVTGLAALIWQTDPTLEAAQVKAAILENVDTMTVLNGKCTSGGKINAYKALRSVMTKREAHVLTGDINGDGVEDQVVSGCLNGYLRLSTFLGEGDGSFAQADHTFSIKTYVHSDPLFIGDVNGDGYDDVVLHWVSNSKRQLMTFLGDRNGHLNMNSDQKGYNSAINLKYDLTNNPSKSFLTDVTGDGCADFVCHMKMNNGNRGFWVYKGIAGGTGFNTTAVATSSTRSFIYEDPVFMDDVNGDDIPDLVVHWASDTKRQLLTYTSTGTGSFNTPVNLATNNTHDTAQYPSKLMLGDATGDGCADFVVMWKNSSGKRCILQYNGTVNSSGNATFLAGIHMLTSTNNYVENDPVYLEDVTGDGKKDVIVYWVSNIYRQMLVYKSSGSGYAAGVNFSAQNRDNNDYPSDHCFAEVDASDSGREMLFRWAHRVTQEMHFHTFNSYSSGLFYGLPINTTLFYFPFYIFT